MPQVIHPSVLPESAFNTNLGFNSDGSVSRREPDYEQYENYPDIANVRIPVDIYPVEAPDPVRDTDFWAQGKPITHAWSFAQRWISTSIPQWLSVDAWNADGPRVAKYIRSNIPKTPLGVQAAFIERVNIERAQSVPYGSTTKLLDMATQTVMDMR